MPNLSSLLRGPSDVNGAASVVMGSTVPGPGVSTNRRDCFGNDIVVNDTIRFIDGSIAQVVGFAGSRLLFTSSKTPLRLGTVRCADIEVLKLRQCRVSAQGGICGSCDYTDQCWVAG